MRPILGVFWCRGRVRVRAGGSWALVLQFNDLGLVPGCFFGLSPASCCHAAEMAKVAAQEQDEPPGGECGKLTFKKATLRGGSGNQHANISGWQMQLFVCPATGRKQLCRATSTESCVPEQPRKSPKREWNGWYAVSREPGGDEVRNLEPERERLKYRRHGLSCSAAIGPC